MKVAETIAIAREWVEQKGRRQPGFRAAHLMGSLTVLPREASFPIYRDVDIGIVLSGEAWSEQENVGGPYRGLVIDCGFYPDECYHSPEVVLSDPGLAPHLAADSVLCDPHGMLGKIQDVVVREYARRHWVRTRCESQKRLALHRLDQLDQADSVENFCETLYLLVVQPLCGLLAIACLRNPTHRRSLALARELLMQAGRPALHEALLDLLGHASLSREEVSAWLEPLSAAFEYAVAVKRSPSPFGFKVHPDFLPYFVEGARELIDEGLHREAMWWLVCGYWLSNAVIQNDGSPEAKALHYAQFGRIRGTLVTSTALERHTRTRVARRIADEIFALADELVDQNQLIAD